MKWFASLIVVFGTSFLVSCSQEEPAIDLKVELSYANGNSANGVIVHLFVSEEDFTSLNTDNADSKESDESGTVKFEGLDNQAYWVWAKTGTRSGGGKVWVSPGENTLGIVLK